MKKIIFYSVFSFLVGCAVMFSVSTFAQEIIKENEYQLSENIFKYKNKNFKGSDDEIDNLTYIYGKLEYISFRLNQIEKKCGR